MWKGALVLALVAVAANQGYLWYTSEGSYSTTSDVLERFGHPDMEGQVVLVTGSNTGLGYETALALARTKATVVLACRSLSRCKKAADTITSVTGNPNVHVFELNLSSFDSVRKFAKDFQKAHSKLHVLIANAGTISWNFEAVEGMEPSACVNHFSHFLLVHLLKDTLIASAPARVVVVSSLIHWLPNPFSFDVSSFPLEREKFTNGSFIDGFYTYAQSKAANVLFSNELNRRLAPHNVTSNALHPGCIHSGIVPSEGLWGRFVALVNLTPIMKTMSQGAATSVYAALVSSPGGQYFENCGASYASPAVLRPSTADELWRKSEAMLGVQF